MGEDGSLVFDTTLDNTGFEKGSQKLENAIKDLVNTVDNLGDNMMRSFGQVIPLLQSVANSAAAISAKLTDSASQAADANAQVVSSEEQVAQAAQTATNAINQQTQSMGNMQSGAQAAQNSANTMSQTSGGYEKAMQKIQKQIDTLKSKLADYYQAVAQIQQSTDESLALAATDEQAAKVMEMEEVQLENLNAKYASKLDTLKALEAEYERLAQLQAQQNASPDSSAWDSKGLSSQIEKAIAAVDKYEDKVNRMQYMGATDQQWKAVYYDITQAGYKLEDFKGLLDSMHAAGGIDSSQYERLSIALDQARQKAAGLASATQGARSFTDVLKSAGAAALKLAGTMAKIPVNAARSGFKKLSQSVSDYVKRAQSAKLSSNALVKALSSVKRMLVSRIKRMFISEIFNGVKESLSALEQYSASFGAAMNRIKTAAAGVKTNLAATIGNLIEAVEPYITKFLNLLSKAIQYVNAVFSFLGGKSSVTTANTAAQSAGNYANNMGSAAKNTKKAADAQKELNRQVYGFDELNKRMKEEEEDEEDDNENPASQFSDLPIDDVLSGDMKDWLKELKDLWDNEDYFGFGQKLAEKLNELMQIADDWINNVFRPAGVKWAKNIAEVLNGLVDGFDAELCGKLIADGLNAIFDIVNTFLTTFDFEKFGQRIGEIIKSFFANVEWDLIGKTFANGINAIVDTLHGLVNAIDWKDAGDSIAEFFNNFATGINWNKLVKTVSDGVSGIETAILNLVKGIQWREIASMIAESLGQLDVAGIITKFGAIVSEVLKGVMSFIAEFIKKVDWGELFQGLWDGLVGLIQSIDWGGLLSLAFELLGAAVGALSNLALTLVKNILDLLISAFEDTWSYFADYIDKCGGDIVAGLLLGIVNALVNIATWIWDHIFKPFWDGLCHAFGIASPSTKMMEIGTYIIEGLLAGIKAAWVMVTEFFSTALNGVKTAISTAWETIKTATVTAWEGIKNGITTAFDTAKNTLTTTATTIQNALSTAWTNVKTTASTSWNSVKTEITTKFDAIKTSIKTTADNVSTTLKTSWTTLKTDATTKWKEITTNIKTNFEAVKQPVKTASDNVKKTLTDAWDQLQRESRTKWDYIKREITQPMSEIERNMSYAWDNIKRNVSYAWESIRSTIMDKWNSVKNAIGSSARYDWQDIGTRLVEGLRNGISRAWSGLTSWVSGLMNSLTRFVNRIFGIHSPSKVWAEIGEYLDLGLMEGLKSEEGNIFSTVSDIAKGVNEEMALDEASVSFADGVDGTTSELARVANLLSDIAATFQSVTAMLSDIGGIRIPGLISGSVVPARTAVSDRDSDVFSSSRFETFTSDLDERLVAQMDVFEEIRDLLRRFRSGIDEDQLAEAIAFAMGNSLRGYGGV